MALQDKDLPRLTAHIAEHGSAEGFVPTPRKKRSQEESQMQRALIKWWQLQCRVFGVPELCLFSIPNGGGRSGPRVGSLLKAEGLRKGAPDLMVATARKHVEVDGVGPQSTCWMQEYHGLFLELKRKDGRLSPEQEVYHEILRKQGYCVKVAWSLTEAINIITAYLHP